MSAQNVPVSMTKAQKPVGRRISREIRVNAGAWILLLPSLFSFILFSWRPLLSGIILSFFKTKGYEAVSFVGFANYLEVFQSSVFKSAIVNTFSYTLWSLAIGFLVPLVVAIMITEMVHFKSFFKFSVYFPVMIPSMAAALLWYFMFDPGQGGILNALLTFFDMGRSEWLQNDRLTVPLIVVTMTWRAFGSTTLMYMASLAGVNHELYEAASLDGASIFQRIRHITLPQISNIIGLLFIMQIIGVFQTMQEPLAMTEGGPNNASMTLMLESYYDAFRYFNAGRSMAVGGITFVLLAAMTVIYMAVKQRAESDD